jgi:hypothetical protein
VGKGWLKERCGLESRTNYFSFKKSPKTGCGLDSRIYGIWGNVGTVPHIPNVAADGGKWSFSSVSCFMPGSESKYPLDRRLGGT